MHNWPIFSPKIGLKNFMKIHETKMKNMNHCAMCDLGRISWQTIQLQESSGLGKFREKNMEEINNNEPNIFIIVVDDMSKVKDVLSDLNLVEKSSAVSHHHQFTKVLENNHARTEILDVEHYMDDENQMHMKMKLSIIKKNLRIKIIGLFILFLVLTVCTFLLLDYALNKS